MMFFIYPMEQYQIQQMPKDVNHWQYHLNLNEWCGFSFFLLDRFLTARHTCVAHCPSGMFANVESGQCEECSQGCVMCQTANLCQQCHSGLYMENRKCVVECQRCFFSFIFFSLLNSHKCKTSVTSCSYLSGLLLRGIPKDLECLPCSTGCGSCVESIFHCLSCERPYLLLNNSCVLQCPEGYYANDTECYHCPAHCTECNQYGLCKSKYDRWNSEVERNGRCGKELFWKAILAEQIREMRKGCRRGIDRKCRELCRCCLDC